MTFSEYQPIIQLLDRSNFFLIITADSQGKYSFVNQTYQGAFHYIDDNFVGKPYEITMHPEDTKICAEVAAKCFSAPDKSFPATIRKHDGKGGYIVTQWEYRAILTPAGEPDGIFCIGYDITQFRLAKAEIDQKRKLLDQIGWEQSHLIRKPVANIIGLVNVLDKSQMDQNQRTIYQMILESALELDEQIIAIVNKSNL